MDNITIRCRMLTETDTGRLVQCDKPAISATGIEICVIHAAKVLTTVRDAARTGAAKVFMAALDA